MEKRLELIQFVEKTEGKEKEIKVSLSSMSKFIIALKNLDSEKYINFFETEEKKKEIYDFINKEMKVVFEKTEAIKKTNEEGITKNARTISFTIEELITFEYCLNTKGLRIMLERLENSSVFKISSEEIVIEKELNAHKILAILKEYSRKSNYIFDPSRTGEKVFELVTPCQVVTNQDLFLADLESIFIKCPEPVLLGFYQLDTNVTINNLFDLLKIKNKKIMIVSGINEPYLFKGVPGFNTGNGYSHQFSLSTTGGALSNSSSYVTKTTGQGKLEVNSLLSDYYKTYYASYQEITNKHSTNANKQPVGFVYKRGDLKIIQLPYRLCSGNSYNHYTNNNYEDLKLLNFISKMILEDYDIKNFDKYMSDYKKHFINIFSKALIKKEQRERIDKVKADIRSREGSFSNISQQLKAETVKLRELVLLKDVLENTDIEKQIKDFSNQFNIIYNMKPVKNLYFENGKICVETFPLEIYEKSLGSYFYMGEYTLEIDMVSTGSIKTAVSFRNKRKVTGYNDRPCTHPHVIGDNDTACLGELEAILADCYRNNDYVSIVSSCIQFLRTVNLNDAAGKYVTRWPESKTSHLKDVTYQKVAKQNEQEIKTEAPEETVEAEPQLPF